VRVTKVSVFDVAVTILSDSPTFCKWVGVYLSGDNHQQLWIPPGLARGFLVTINSEVFLYKTNDYYARQAEGLRGVCRPSAGDRLAAEGRVATVVWEGCRCGAVGRTPKDVMWLLLNPGVEGGRSDHLCHKRRAAVRCSP
jgi:hypothetical protein